MPSGYTSLDHLLEEQAPLFDQTNPLLSYSRNSQYQRDTTPGRDVFAQQLDADDFGGLYTPVAPVRARSQSPLRTLRADSPQGSPSLDEALAAYLLAELSSDVDPGQSFILEHFSISELGHELWIRTRVGTTRLLRKTSTRLLSVCTTVPFWMLVLLVLALAAPTSALVVDDPHQIISQTRSASQERYAPAPSHIIDVLFTTSDYLLSFWETITDDHFIEDWLPSVLALFMATTILYALRDNFLFIYALKRTLVNGCLRNTLEWFLRREQLDAKTDLHALRDVLDGKLPRLKKSKSGHPTDSATRAQARTLQQSVISHSGLSAYYISMSNHHLRNGSRGTRYTHTVEDMATYAVNDQFICPSTLDHRGVVARDTVICINDTFGHMDTGERTEIMTSDCAVTIGDFMPTAPAGKSGTETISQYDGKGNFKHLIPGELRNPLDPNTHAHPLYNLEASTTWWARFTVKWNRVVSIMAAVILLTAVLYFHISWSALESPHPVFGRFDPDVTVEPYVHSHLEVGQRYIQYSNSYVSFQQCVVKENFNTPSFSGTNDHWTEGYPSTTFWEPLILGPCDAGCELTVTQARVIDAILRIPQDNLDTYARQIRITREVWHAAIKYGCHADDVPVVSYADILNSDIDAAEAAERYEFYTGVIHEYANRTGISDPGEDIRVLLLAAAEVAEDYADGAHHAANYLGSFFPASDWPKGALPFTHSNWFNGVYTDAMNPFGDALREDVTLLRAVPCRSETRSTTFILCYILLTMTPFLFPVVVYCIPVDVTVRASILRRTTGDRVIHWSVPTARVHGYAGFLFYFLGTQAQCGYPAITPTILKPPRSQPNSRSEKGEGGDSDLPSGIKGLSKDIYVMEILKDQDIWTVACIAGSTVSYEVNSATMAAINGSLLESKGLPSNHTIARNSALTMPEDQALDPWAATIFIHVALRTRGPHYTMSHIERSLAPPRCYTVGPTIEDLDHENPGGMRAFTTPLVSGGDFTPATNTDGSKARFAATRLLAGRVIDEEVTREQDKYINEFIAMLLKNNFSDKPPMIIPCSVEDVRARRNRPSQQAAIDAACDIAESNMPGVFVREELAAFLKAECYSKYGNPRGITTFEPVATLLMAVMVYAMSDNLKQVDWYAFGKQPDQIAERICDITANAQVFAETDFTEYDGTISSATRRFELALYLALFDPKYHHLVYEGFDRDYGNFVKISKSLFNYDQRNARGSGSGATAFANGYDNALTGFTALRLSGCTPQQAWERLGIYGGDDGGTPDIDDKLYIKAAELYHLSLKVDIVERGNPITFLSRYYCPWTGSKSNCTDVPRQLNKVHMTHRPQTTDYEVILADKVVSLYVTDRNTPVIGPIVTALVEHSHLHSRALRKAKTKLDLQYHVSGHLDGGDQTAVRGIIRKKQEFSAAFNNRHEDWMDALVDKQLPGLNYNCLNEYIALLKHKGPRCSKQDMQLPLLCELPEPKNITGEEIYEHTTDNIIPASDADTTARHRDIVGRQAPLTAEEKAAPKAGPTPIVQPPSPPASAKLKAYLVLRPALKDRLKPSAKTLKEMFPNRAFSSLSKDEKQAFHRERRSDAEAQWYATVPNHLRKELSTYNAAESAANKAAKNRVAPSERKQRTDSKDAGSPVSRLHNQNARSLILKGKEEAVASTCQ